MNIFVFQKKMTFINVGKFSIHSPDAIKFMERITTDSLVLDTLKEGLKLDFVDQPGPYYEANNWSCLDNLEIAQQKVASWVVATLPKTDIQNLLQDNAV